MKNLNTDQKNATETGGQSHFTKGCIAAHVPFSRTRALQPVATCRQSHYDVILIVTLATELATPTVTDVRTSYRV